MCPYASHAIAATACPAAAASSPISTTEAHATCRPGHQNMQQATWLRLVRAPCISLQAHFAMMKNEGLAVLAAQLAQQVRAHPEMECGSRNTRNGDGSCLAMHSFACPARRIVNRTIQVVGPRKQSQRDCHRQRMACNINAPCRWRMPNG